MLERSDLLSMQFNIVRSYGLEAAISKYMRHPFKEANFHFAHRVFYMPMAYYNVS